MYLCDIQYSGFVTNFASMQNSRQNLPIFILPTQGFAPGFYILPLQGFQLPKLLNRFQSFLLFLSVHSALPYHLISPSLHFLYLSSSILMFLKETALPWSCSRIYPSFASPKSGQSLYLLPATRSFHF